MLAGATPLAAHSQSRSQMDMPIQRNGYTPAGGENLSDGVAAHVAGLKFEQLDAATLEKTRRRVIDLVGCALAGTRMPTNIGLAELTRDWGGPQEATLIGFPGKVGAANAAMFNAITSRTYDFEVMTAVVRDRAVPSHTSPTTVMTALAMAESGHHSGAEFLTALTLGDDLVARVLAASGFDFSKGWDAASVYSALGSTAIAGRLLGLSPLQVRDALGITINNLAGTIQGAWDGTADFTQPQGAAARNGIVSAQMAAHGWTSMFDPLMAPYGFFAQYTGGCERPELLSTDLGSAFFGEEYFKPYPACAATHACLECAANLREKYALKPDQISRVVVQLSDRLLKNFCGKPYQARRFPQCDANFSYAFQVATTLLDGPTALEHYAEDRLRGQRLAEMIARIELLPMTTAIAPDPRIAAAGGWASGGAIVEVETTDGRRLVETLHELHRHPVTGPTPKSEIVRKFHHQAAFAGWSVTRAENVLAAIERLHEMPDVTELTSLLSA